MGENWTDSTTFPLTYHHQLEPVLIFSLGYRYCNKRGVLFDIYPTLQRSFKQSENYYIGVGFGMGI